MQRADFAELFPGATPLACDLVSKMLQFDPRRRISVKQALKHPYLAALHDEAEEPVAARAAPACTLCVLMRLRTERMVHRTTPCVSHSGAASLAARRSQVEAAARVPALQGRLTLTSRTSD